MTTFRHLSVIGIEISLGFLPHLPATVVAGRLQIRADMSARRTLDRCPGSTPEIRTLGDDLTFQFDIAGLPERIKLFLRCDAAGDVLVSLATGFEERQHHNRAA